MYMLSRAVLIALVVSAASLGFGWWMSVPPIHPTATSLLHSPSSPSLLGVIWTAEDAGEPYSLTLGNRDESVATQRIPIMDLFYWFSHFSPFTFTSTALKGLFGGSGVIPYAFKRLFSVEDKSVLFDDRESFREYEPSSLEETLERLGGSILETPCSYYGGFPTSTLASWLTTCIILDPSMEPTAPSRYSTSWGKTINDFLGPEVCTWMRTVHGFAMDHRPIFKAFAVLFILFAVVVCMKKALEMSGTTVTRCELDASAEFPDSACDDSFASDVSDTPAWTSDDALTVYLYSEDDIEAEEEANNETKEVDLLANISAACDDIYGVRGTCSAFAGPLKKNSLETRTEYVLNSFVGGSKNGILGLPEVGTTSRCDTTIAHSLIFTGASPTFLLDKVQNIGESISVHVLFDASKFLPFAELPSSVIQRAFFGNDHTNERYHTKAIQMRLTDSWKPKLSLVKLSPNPWTVLANALMPMTSNKTLYTAYASCYGNDATGYMSNSTNSLPSLVSTLSDQTVEELEEAFDLFINDDFSVEALSKQNPDNHATFRHAHTFGHDDLHSIGTSHRSPCNLIREYIADAFSLFECYEEDEVSQARLINNPNADESHVNNNVTKEHLTYMEALVDFPETVWRWAVEGKCIQQELAIYSPFVSLSAADESNLEGFYASVYGSNANSGDFTPNDSFKTAFPGYYHLDDGEAYALRDNKARNVSALYEASESDAGDLILFSAALLRKYFREPCFQSAFVNASSQNKQEMIPAVQALFEAFDEQQHAVIYEHGVFHEREILASQGYVYQASIMSRGQRRQHERDVLRKLRNQLEERGIDPAFYYTSIKL